MGNNAVTGLRRVTGRATPGSWRTGASPWEGPPAPPAQPRPARWVLHRAPLAPVILGTCLVVGLVRVLAVLGRPVTPYGDPAIIEIQTRMAIRFQALLGPYSRFGWHHPGPAYFYALAPFYALAGHSMAALVLGQLVINATAAVAVVVIIRRRLGEGVARWAAAAVGVYVAVSGPAVLLYVWNPLILSLPFLVMVVLVAVAATGSLPALAWAAVAGTFVGQSDVSAVPEVALVLVLGLAATGARVVRDRRRGRAGLRPRRRSTRPAVLVGAAGLVLLVGLWIPPLYQEVTGHPGNLTALVRFFLSHQHGSLVSSHPLGEAAAASVYQLTWLPLGGVPPQSLAPLPAAVSPLRAVLAAVYFADAVVVVVAAWRLRERLALVLGLCSSTCMLLAVYATTRVVGPIFPYLIAWIDILPVPAWIGSALVARAWWRRRARGNRPPLGAGAAARARYRALADRLAHSARGAAAARWALVLLVALPAGILTYEFSEPLPVAPGDHVEVPALLLQANVELRGLHAHRVLVQINDNGVWPAAVAMVDALQSEGDQVYLTSPYWEQFDQRLRPVGRATAAVVLAKPGDPRAPATGATRFPSPDGTVVMWVAPLPPGANWAPS